MVRDGGEQTGPFRKTLGDLSYFRCFGAPENADARFFHLEHAFKTGNVVILNISLSHDVGEFVSAKPVAPPQPPAG